VLASYIGMIDSYIQVHVTCTHPFSFLSSFNQARNRCMKLEREIEEVTNQLARQKFKVSSR
jgi:hypothetical protein